MSSDPRTIALTGTLPDFVLSVALDPSARYALVLDRVGSSQHRLIRVDLRTGTSTLLYNDTSPTAFSVRGLASLPDGSWAMGAWTANGGPSMVQFRVALVGSAITVSRKASSSGRVLGRFRGSSRGLSWAGADATYGWLPRGVPFVSMTTGTAADLYALF